MWLMRYSLQIIANPLSVRKVHGLLVHIIEYNPSAPTFMLIMLVSLLVSIRCGLVGDDVS